MPALPHQISNKNLLRQIKNVHKLGGHYVPLAYCDKCLKTLKSFAEALQHVATDYGN